MASGRWVNFNRTPIPKMAYLLFVFGTLILSSSKAVDARGYFGKRIGSLSELQHAVRGEVYAVDSRTIYIKGFSYDGTAPDAFFYAGKTGNEPHDQGIIIPDEKGSKEPLAAYNNKDVTLTLPDGLTLKDISWISIWCRAYTINFGHLMVPRNFDYPRPQKIDALPTFEHGVSSDKIVVVDAQTFLISNFHYDGQAPDAFFWVGKGAKPGPSGTLVPDENGSLEPLKRYTGKTIVITLPGDLTVFDIDYLSVWCREFYADFGHIRMPRSLNVPPSLKMLGVAPQTKLNCEVLYDDLAFEVRWAVAGDSIVIQLVGKVENGEYMAFGLSGDDTKSVMDGGDVTVAWLDQVTGQGEAVDYILNAKSQCQGSRGSCPDNITGSVNNVRLLNAAFINSFTMLTFQRPLGAGDTSDKAIDTTRPQAVIWAIGPVNSQGEVSYHRLKLRGDMFIDFGRSPNWNCPLPEKQDSRATTKTDGQSRISSSGGATQPTAARPLSSSNAPWKIPPIPCYEPEDGVFYAQIGPTGGDRGYNAITGHVGWGIAWYINGLLIPEVNVVRGKTYTFVVEGGADPESPAKFHPFYITDDPEGGYEFKTKAEKSSVRVFAGVEVARDGSASPTATGRLCEWKQSPAKPADSFESFGAYQRSLTLDCQEGQPGILQWTPDADTPNTIYYQCFTHRFLGWKINVVDPQRCDGASASRTQQTLSSTRGSSRADFDYYLYDDHIDSKTRTSDVTLGGSTRYEAKVPPRDSFNNIDSLPSYEDLEKYSSRPFGFDSFPFGMSEASSPDDSTTSNVILRSSSRTRTKQGVRLPSPKVSLGTPEFQFPKLPPLKMGNPVVNATAFNGIDRFSFSRSSPKLVSKLERQGEDSIKPFTETGKDDSENEVYSEGEKPDQNSRRLHFSLTTLRPYFPKEWRKRRPINRNKQQYSKPAKKPVNLLDRTTEAQLITAFEIKDHEVYPFKPELEIPHQEKKLEYQSPPQRSSRPSRTKTILSTVKKPSYEVKENPTERPVVIAKPYNHTITHNNRRNHKVKNKFSQAPKTPPQELFYSETNRVSHYPAEESGQEAHFSRFQVNKKYHQVNLDSNTGLPYATNSGFDPSTIVFENDFRPIRAGGLMLDPALSFKVSSTTLPVGSRPQNPLVVNPHRRETPNNFGSTYHSPQISVHSEQPQDTLPQEHFVQGHGLNTLRAKQAKIQQSYQIYEPYQRELIDYANSNDKIDNIERTGDSEVLRPALPAFRLRPPPPPSGSPFKRFARKMSGFEEKADSQRDPHHRMLSMHNEGTLSTRSRDSVGIPSEALTLLLQAPPPQTTSILTSVKVFDHPKMATTFKEYYHQNPYINDQKKANDQRVISKNEGGVMRRFLPPPFLNENKRTEFENRSTPTVSMTDGIKDFVQPSLKLDYSKLQEQLIKSATKSTHLTILKDIWDNLTDEKTRNFS